MTPTWIGLVLLLVGSMLIVRGSILTMLGFTLACTLLGGSSAINLPALSGAAIQPAYLALGFLILRILLADGPQRTLFGPALSANSALLVFCLYGAVGAILLPRMFQGMIDVTPMKPTEAFDLFGTDPLKPTSQNITSGVYLLGTAMAAMTGWIASKGHNAAHRIAGFIGWITLANVAMGLIALALISAGRLDVVTIIRNGNYGALDQNYRGIVRMAGFFPEASAYAAYSIPLMVATAEMWLRNIRPRLTGPAALSMLTILFISTSATAYVGVFAYAAILLVRFLLFPSAITPKKIFFIITLALVACTLSLAAMLVLPELARTFSDMFTQMTVGKGQTSSGIQRQFWAQQGIDAFKVSYGIGIGAGSFRSSSLGTAIAGSMGVIGLIAFAVFVWNVIKPLRASTYMGQGCSQSQSVGAALGWASIGLLAPAMVSAPSPDPGLVFSLLGGLALGLRSSSLLRPAASPPVQEQSSMREDYVPQQTSERTV